jgi:hypothetical protein
MNALVVYESILGSSEQSGETLSRSKSRRQTFEVDQQLRGAKLPLILTVPAS